MPDTELNLKINSNDKGSSMHRRVSKITSPEVFLSQSSHIILSELNSWSARFFSRTMFHLLTPDDFLVAQTFPIIHDMCMSYTLTAKNCEN